MTRRKLVILILIALGALTVLVLMYEPGCGASDYCSEELR
jgi:hypothetical protein